MTGDFLVSKPGVTIYFENNSMKIMKKVSFSIMILVFLITIYPVYAEQEVWEELEPMPTARSEVGAAAIGQKIYVVGGYVEKVLPTDTVEVYNIDENIWYTVSPLPAKLHHPAAASFDGKLYVVGGYSADYSITPGVNSLYIYDPNSDIWSQGADMPTARGALTASFINGKLYAVGGKDHFTLVSNEAYDPLTDTWTKKAHMPTPRDHLASAVIDDKLYVFGGRQDSTASRNVDANEIYDPNTDTWKKLEPLPTPRSGLSAVTLNGTIFVMGGESFSKMFEENEQYIPGEGWISHLPLHTPRHGFGGVAVDGRIYTIGGGTYRGFSFSNINESYYNPNVIPEFGVMTTLILVFSLIVVTIMTRNYFLKISRF